MWLIAICTFLFIFYAALIIYYSVSWRQVPLFKVTAAGQKTKFSVIIPARNEERNIPVLLESILSQRYPKNLYEIIVVDDHSTDHTAKIVEGFIGVKLVRLEAENINSYKKKAIETGITAAQNEWLVCTDGDCIVPENWLLTLDGVIQQKQPVFIAAPVSLVAAPSHQRENNKLLYIFQALDFMTLQGITGASVFKKIHNMCNGANLAYKKDAFLAVGGFKGIDGIASGDDMLLMHKIWKKYAGKIEYLKSQQAIVETGAAPTWRSFFNQRIRWASKAKTYDDKRIFGVLLWVYLFNFSFAVLAIASFFGIKYLYILLILWLAKTLVEFLFIAPVAQFFNKRNLLKYFFFFQPLHIAYTIISGFLGSFGTYEWKGRRVK